MAKHRDTTETAPGLATVPGARAIARRAYRQDLARVPAPEPWPPGLVLAPWDASAIPLHVAVATGTVGGFYLTDPAPPTAARFHAAFEALGGIVPGASFVARLGEVVQGALVCVAGETAGEADLFDLVVAPEARSQGLARHLVRAWQAGLVAGGYATARFVTTADHAVVHRLFTPEEILDMEEAPGGCFRGARR